MNFATRDDLHDHHPFAPRDVRAVHQLVASSSLWVEGVRVAKRQLEGLDPARMLVQQVDQVASRGVLGGNLKRNCTAGYETEAGESRAACVASTPDVGRGRPATKLL